MSGASRKSLLLHSCLSAGILMALGLQWSPSLSSQEASRQSLPGHLSRRALGGVALCPPNQPLRPPACSHGCSGSPLEHPALEA